MSILLPKLDDRTFDQLVEQALERARATCPEWTDHSPGDPGVTLIELFAFLTDAMLYRLNRIPPRLRLALLRLAGVSLRPPSAALAELVFSREDDDTDREIKIPAGTPIESGDGSARFLLTEGVTIAAGATSAKGLALHCEQVAAEDLGTTSGTGSDAFQLAQPPVIAATNDDLDLVLGIELKETEQSAGLPLRTHGGRTFEIWREVRSFADSAPEDPVYIVDRGAGLIELPPSAAANAGAGRIPTAGRNVRAWYRRGGGLAGNVAADVLTNLPSGPGGVTVTNPERAAGGSDAETIEALERRAPSAIASLRVAVTARDYEQIVLETGGFSRAHAYAKAQVWNHADPGVVEVAAMPRIETDSLANGAVTLDVVENHRVEALRQRAVEALDRHRPLGVRSSVAWAQVRAVSVAVRVVIGSEADPVAVEEDVIQRINALFSPMRDLAFGREIRASEVYERILNVPGVRYADQVRFSIDETPASNVRDLIRDPIQPHAWFACADDTLYRTLDDGESWASVARHETGKPRFLRRHPTRPGLAVLAVADENSSTLTITKDLGENWDDPIASFPGTVYDCAWIERDGRPLLLVATDQGMRQLIPESGSGPSPVIVDKQIDTKGFYSVVSNVSPSGVISVAVVARGLGGVYLSSSGGISGSFKPVGLEDSDVRRLAIQHTGGRDFLWASLGAEAGEDGEGAQRIELRASGESDPAGFVPYDLGWRGGSCEDLAFSDTIVVAGSNRAGILLLDTAAAKPGWRPIKLDAGLPIRDTERLLEVVETVAAGEGPDGDPIILSGGVRGVHRSTDGGERFHIASATSFTDHVPLPTRWLYCVGSHEITLTRDDDGRR